MIQPIGNRKRYLFQMCSDELKWTLKILYKNQNVKQNKTYNTFPQQLRMFAVIMETSDTGK